MTFTIRDSFAIDADELAGVTAEAAFVLGAEFALFRARMLASTRPFEDICHAPNAPRLIAMARRHGRSATTRCVDTTWVQISIGAPRPN